MSEEEKEAIEELKNRQGYRVDFKCKRCNSGDVFIIPPEVLYGKEIDIALNLIDRLQKENEELKEKEKNLLLQLKDSEKELLEVTQNSVSKDKIKDKIKELDMQQKQFREDRENKHTDKEILYAISVLESLLEGE